MTSLDYKLSFTTLISPSQTRLPLHFLIKTRRPPYFLFIFVLFFFCHFPPPPSPFSPAAVNGDDGGGCRRGFLRPLPLTRKPSLLPPPSSSFLFFRVSNGGHRRRRRRWCRRPHFPPKLHLFTFIPKLKPICSSSFHSFFRRVSSFSGDERQRRTTKVKVSFTSSSCSSSCSFPFIFLFSLFPFWFLSAYTLRGDFRRVFRRRRSFG